MIAVRRTPHYIRFYAKDGSQIGSYRMRYAHDLEDAAVAAAEIARGIDLRTRRQTAGVDSRKVARTEISTSLHESQTTEEGVI